MDHKAFSELHRQNKALIEAVEVATAALISIRGEAVYLPDGQIDMQAVCINNINTAHDAAERVLVILAGIQQATEPPKL